MPQEGFGTPRYIQLDDAIATAHAFVVLVRHVELRDVVRISSLSCPFLCPPQNIHASMAAANRSIMSTDIPTHYFVEMLGVSL